MMNYLVFDVGGTEIKYNVISKKGEFLQDTVFVDTPSSRQGIHTTKSELKKRFKEIILEIYETTPQPIDGLLFSLPGHIDTRTSYVHMAGALSYLDQTNFNEFFSELNVEICVENDARCAAMAEKMEGNAQDCDDFVVLTLGTGVGSGLCVNGKIVSGSQGKGGEYGTSLVYLEQEGRYRMFHQTCSMSALIDMYADHFNIPKKDLHTIKGKQIFAEIDNPEVKKIINSWYENIAVCIMNIACTLNPQKVLIGGGISHREDLPIELNNALVRVIEKCDQKNFWDMYQAEIDVCKFANNAGLLGAYYIYQQK